MNFDVDLLTEKTRDAYSAEAYPSWRALVVLLKKRGFNVFEAEAILRSKITRWARDMDERSGQHSANTLRRYLDKYKVVPGCEEVNDLVRGTFPSKTLGIDCLGRLEVVENTFDDGVRLTKMGNDLMIMDQAGYKIRVTAENVKKIVQAFGYMVK